jgi:endonuclease/exonuclease/phosphatase family metal-dependent hydrolase
VFNSHLDHESQPSRERSVILLSKRVEQEAGDLPVVLTGDFNAGEENPAVRYLSGRGSLPYPEAEWAGRRSYRDSFRALNTDRRNTGTFNGFKGTADQEKIDFIWGSSSIRVLQADIVRDNDAGRYPSDHFPVTATVCLPPSP